jgi:hypothetical protein
MTEPLTESELRVARYLLAADLSTEDIGHILHISTNTVKTHARHVYRKLGATGGRKELRKDPKMRRICNGQDPNLKTPDGKIGNCGAVFDDVTAWTICPHEEFSPGPVLLEPYAAPHRQERAAYENERLQLGRPDLHHHHHPLAITGCDGDCKDPAETNAYAVILMEPSTVMWLTLEIDAARAYAARNGGVVVAMPFVFDFRGQRVDEAETMARGIYEEGTPAGAAAFIAANMYGRPQDAARIAKTLRATPPTPGPVRVPLQSAPPLDEAAEPAPGCADYRGQDPPAERCGDPTCARCWPGWLPQ